MTTTTTTTPKYATLPGWFASFCDPDDSRYDLSRPWLHGDGCIYATDGRAVVWVRAGLVAEAGWPQRSDHPKKRHPSRIRMDAICGTAPGDGWEAEPLALPPAESLPPAREACPECGGEPRKPRVIRCEWCDGEGRLDEWDDLDDEDDDGTCEECNGRGKWPVRSCDYCHNAGTIPNRTTVVIPGRADRLTLAAGQLHRVLEAGGVLYARERDAHKSALKFTIGEDFEGRLMPVNRE